MRVLIKTSGFEYTGVVNHFEKIGSSNDLSFNVTIDGTLENKNFNGDWVYGDIDRVIEPCMAKLFHDHLLKLDELPDSLFWNFKQ